jgi:hypothetical protein
MSDVVDNSHQEQRNDADPLPEKDPEGWFDVDGSNSQPKEVDHGFASTPNVDKPLTNGQSGQEPENAFNETTTIVESNQSEPASVSWGFDQEPGTSHDGFAPNVETISDTSQRGKDETERSGITARVSTIAFAETPQISDEGDEIGSVAMSAQEEPANEPVRDLPQLCRSVSATFLHKHPPRPPFFTSTVPTTTSRGTFQSRNCSHRRRKDLSTVFLTGTTTEEGRAIFPTLVPELTGFSFRPACLYRRFR